MAPNAMIHLIGTYKNLWTVPTKAQRTIFDIFEFEYHWKGETFNNQESDNLKWDTEQEEELT